MSNRRKLITTKPPLSPEQIAQVATLMNEKGGNLNRRLLRSFRRNVPVAAYLQDHHKPHDAREDCGPSCSSARITST